MSELALKLKREAKEIKATRLEQGNYGLTKLVYELVEVDDFE